MDTSGILGIEIPPIDWEGLLTSARDFALPRAIETIIAFVLAAVVFLVARRVTRSIEKRLTSRTETELDDKVIDLARSMLSLSVIFWAIWRLSNIWELPQLANVVSAGWIVALAFPASRFVSDLLELLEKGVVHKTKTKLDDTALPLINKTIRFVVIAIAVLMGMAQLGIAIGPFLGGAGVIGVALSFAAKDTLSNLIAGVLLIVDRPFQVGDRIELWNAPPETGSWGDIVEIGLRATKIRNPDNLIVVIPNNEIMRRDIINYTASGDHIRLRIPIGIGYGADSDLAKKLILEAAGETKGVMEKPTPVVILRRFGDSSVDFQLRVWIKNARRRRAIGDEITERVKTLFDEHGVEIPFPQRDITIRTAPGTELPVGDDGAEIAGTGTARHGNGAEKGGDRP